MMILVNQLIVQVGRFTRSGIIGYKSIWSDQMSSRPSQISPLNQWLRYDGRNQGVINPTPYPFNRPEQSTTEYGQQSYQPYQPAYPDQLYQQPIGTNQFNQDQQVLEEPEEEPIGGYPIDSNWYVPEVDYTKMDSFTLKVAVMYLQDGYARMVVIPITIGPENSYANLISHIIDTLNLDIQQNHGYIMTQAGMMDLTNYHQPVMHDLDNIAQDQDSQYHILIMLAHPNRTIVSSTLYSATNGLNTKYSLYEDLIIKQGGPFTGQPERWIDITDMLIIKVAIAPCERCSKSKGTCYNGLIYTKDVVVVEVKVTPNTRYFDITQNIKAQLMNLHRSIDFISRTFGNGIKPKDIQPGQFYLFNGQQYINFSKGDRLVFQDYYLWKQWEELSNQRDYGLYLHLCPPDMEAIEMSYDQQDIVTRTTWFGGNPNRVDNRAIFSPPVVQLEYYQE